jgi:GNAT superfamily N-acetyltransferase
LENLKEGMSWCAIDESTGELVGMIISCEISLDSLPNARLTFDQYMELGLSRELVLILILCDCILNSNLKQMMLDYKVTEMIKLHSLRVHPSYRNKGIAAELVKISLAHVIKLGYTLLGVICFGIYSQKIFERLGFVMVNKVEYASYIDPVTNTHLFENVKEPHKCGIGYVKKL